MSNFSTAFSNKRYNNSKESTYICPNCGQDLIGDEQKYMCISCSSGYPIIDGIPLFSGNKDYYFGEASKEIFLDLLELASKTSTQRALNAFLETNKITSYAYNYGCGRNRGNFFILLKLGHDKKVLDLGCGWGNTSMTLARTFSQCYSMDLTKERVTFLTLRAKEAGLDNITCLCGGDLNFLPFQDNFFDCVLLNGILEWVPENSSTGNPKDIQLNYLKEINRILKDDGQIYIGIENRFGLEYFQDRHDDHTGILYTSILPRFIANIVSKIKRGRGYRTYTYSRCGYQRLLRKAGFHNIAIHIPYPDYRVFDTIFTTNIPASFINYIKTKAYIPSWKTYLKARLMPYMSRSFSIVADNKHGGSESWLSLFVDYLSNHYLKDYGNLGFSGITMSATSGIGVILKNRKNEGIYVGIPVDILSEENHKKQSESIAYLQNKYANTKLSELLPNFIRQDKFRGIDYYIYSSIHIEHMPGEVPKELCFQKLYKFFASESRNSSLIQDNLKISNVLKSFHLSSIVLDNEKNFLGKYNLLLTTAGSRRQSVHGDLWPANIVMNEKGACFVIDWADFEKDGLPLYDLFHFHIYPQSCEKGSWVYMLDKACSEFPTKLERKIVNSFKLVYPNLGQNYFSPERVSSLFLLYIYDNLVRRIRNGQNQKQGLEKLVRVTMKGPLPLPAFTKIINMIHFE